MAWNVLLTGAATLVSLAGIALTGQEPGFDYQVAAPMDGPATATLADYRVGQNQSGGVSARFHDARVGEVLDWLDKQGVSYVIADQSMLDHKVTLNIDDQPVGDIADAIASALGGHWERQGKIRVYRKGIGFGADIFNSQAYALPKGGTWNQLPNGAFGKDGQQFKMWTVPGPDMKDGQQFKMWAVPGPDMKGLTAPGQNFGELFKGDGKEPFFRTFTMGRGFNFDKFSKSLSDHQKDLMKSQGFLKVDDLTRDQREMIGITGDAADLTITYVKDGQTITIKSK